LQARFLDGIENLRTFVAVADAGSLAAAARQLGVAPSVVTKRLDQLESKIRARLFTRTTRRVTLTDLGTRYMSSVRRLMQDYDEVFAEMSNMPTHIEGDLRIKVPTSMTVAYLAQTLADFQQHFPLVNLDVALIDRAVNPLEEGFDVALAGLPSRSRASSTNQSASCGGYCARPRPISKRGVHRRIRTISYNTTASSLCPQEGHGSSKAQAGSRASNSAQR